MNLKNIFFFFRNLISIVIWNIGRAGRFGTQWEHGYVTTFKRTDLPTLKYLLSEKPEPIVQAGLHPTADQIELYAFHLPNSSLSNLLVSGCIKFQYFNIFVLPQLISYNVFI